MLLAPSGESRRPILHHLTLAHGCVDTASWVGIEGCVMLLVLQGMAGIIWRCLRAVGTSADRVAAAARQRGLMSLYDSLPQLKVTNATRKAAPESSGCCLCHRRKQATNNASSGTVSGLCGLVQIGPLQQQGKVGSCPCTTPCST